MMRTIMRTMTTTMAGAKRILCLSMIHLLLVGTVLSSLSAQQPADSFESGRGSRVEWARLKFRVTGDPAGPLGWFHHPTGDLNLIEFLRTKTDINIKEEWNIVEVGNLEHMCQFPLIFLSGLGRLVLNEQEKSNIREYILRGGFFFADDCVSKPLDGAHDIFFSSFRDTLREVLPGIVMKRIPQDHPIFHCYFDLPEWVHVQGTDNGLWGAWYGGRMVAVFNSSDLHCGWVGWYFSEKQKSFSLKIAANIYVYAMEE